MSDMNFDDDIDIGEIEYLYNVLIIGESTVGKTCFLARFTDGVFLEDHIATIGIDSRIKNIKLDDGTNVRIQIWDTAGQEKFRTITKNFYRNADGIILIYDVTKIDSFKSVHTWVKQVKANVSSDVSLVLVGNKIDLEEERQVNTTDGENEAAKYNIKFFETSSLQDVNVTETFMELTHQIHKKLGVRRKKKSTRLAAKKEEKKKEEENKCC